MFSQGEREEVERWLRNFVTSHAKRESPRVEVVVAAEGPRDGRCYAVRLRLGERSAPSPGEEALELPFAEVAEGRSRMAWCEGLAARVRAMARELGEGGRGERKSA
ncbi:MAG: hypothetical protein A2X52_18580 [Candidatus Rokubacteria bacterium GWC2_70_16]|nr:MAG: hypothetical protein A2X52_18580 [Candidatus Rokubacteria bacterium GWC2_70_16]OGL18474.1 MAG: hypothetical protein A3K12_09675 [Candidatus Rokubacteria bacterium RIFCSPLOWO2_12_FULL_71_19]